MGEPSAPLAFTLHAEGEDEIDTTGVTVNVDGADVTADCDVRVPRRWPSNRADFEYRPAGGWSTAAHEVSVDWPGRMPQRAWSFVVR